MSMDFVKKFDKDVEKMSGVGRSSLPPRYWTSTGNYVLNRVISGNFERGIPQGRITTLAGPSASGKSFVAGNIIREAQQDGSFILIVDSENALDDEFMEAIGVDTKNDYYYAGVTTIGEAQKVISSFIKGYKEEYGDDSNAPKILICLDSLSMLLTDTELDNYDKGIQKGDMGQRNKQLKLTLKGFVQDIKSLNISVVTTVQVYKNQDLLNGEGNWIIPDAVRYSASLIILLTKLKLRDTGSRDVNGIRMKCEGYKTRFTKPFQTVTIEVPYETGIDPYNGLLEVATNLGIIQKKGSRYVIAGEDKSWYSKEFNIYATSVLESCKQQNEAFIEVSEDVEEDNRPISSSKTRRKSKTEQTSNAVN